MSSRTIIGVLGIDTTSYAFRNRLVEIADELGINPDYLATVISFESGQTFRPDVRNPLSGCVGLIQFCDNAAVAAAKSAGLNYGPDDAQDWLASMSAVEQLEYVKRYFKTELKGRRNPTLADTYMAVFSPAFIGKPESFVAYQEGQKSYDQNKGFDTNPRDGKITVGEISRTIFSVYNIGLQRPRVETGVAEPVKQFEEGTPLKMYVFGVVVAAMGGAIGYWGYGDYAIEILRKKRWLSSVVSR